MSHDCMTPMNADSEPHPFFSIIVPCCQVARYVDDMVASVRTQSFADWECILSVEESSDTTEAKCRAVASADARFRVIVGPKSGSPATPRNRGLSLAKGRYAVWLDGDDWLADGALARLAAAIQAYGEPEAVQGAVVECTEHADGKQRRVARHFNFAPSENGCILVAGEAMVRFAHRPTFAWPMASLTVCRIDFLRANGLLFVPGLRHEDEEWTPRVLTLAPRLLVLDADLYVYRRRAGSVMTSETADEACAHAATVTRSLLLFFAVRRLPHPVARAWARLVLSFFFDHLFFRDGRPGAPAARLRGDCLRRILEKGGRRAYLKLTRHAGLPKRLAAPFVLLCGFHPLLDLPARAYFRFLYYPLVLWRHRRRAAPGTAPGHPDARERVPPLSR